MGIGSKIEWTENTWNSVSLAGGVDFVYLERKDNYVFDGEGPSVTPRRTAETFEYDQRRHQQSPILQNIS